jgi:predicted transcriptional regulator
MEHNNRNAELVELAADIVSAYVSNNTIATGDLPGLIGAVRQALVDATASNGEAPAEEPKPAVPIRKSVTPDYIVCLEDGKKFKSLKRHIKTHYGLSPEAYRDKLGSAAGLSHGGAQLRRSALGAGQKDGPGSEAPSGLIPSVRSRPSAPCWADARRHLTPGT